MAVEAAGGESYDRYRSRLCDLFRDQRLDVALFPSDRDLERRECECAHTAHGVDNGWSHQLMSSSIGGGKSDIVARIKLTETQRAALLSEYIAGARIDFLARKYGVDRSYPRVLFKRYSLRLAARA